MKEYTDSEDRQLELNLRSAIPLLSIPPAPTAAQRLRWKAATAVQHARRRWGAAAWLSSSVAATCPRYGDTHRHSRAIRRPS